MGPLEVWKALWSEEDSVESLERVVNWFHEGLSQYLLPIILCCMATTGFIFWKLHWYTTLTVYIGISLITTLVIVALMWHLKTGITELRGRQEMTEKLLELLRQVKERELRRKAEKEGRVDPLTELDKHL